MKALTIIAAMFLMVVALGLRSIADLFSKSADRIEAKHDVVGVM